MKKQALTTNSEAIGDQIASSHHFECIAMAFHKIYFRSVDADAERWECRKAIAAAVAAGVRADRRQRPSNVLSEKHSHISDKKENQSNE
jgi:hypothetical protein